MEALYPASEAASIVSILCEDKLGFSKIQHIIEPLCEIPAPREEVLASDIERLCSGEPLQYVLGRADFYGRSYRVSPAVLIPRPETELLVHEALSQLRRMERPFGNAPRVLDLCTGSGCIAWSLAAEVPTSEVCAVDISDDALAVASSQDVSQNRPCFIKADVLSDNFPVAFSKAASASGLRVPASFDVLLSNPPYVRDSEKAQMRKNVLEHEPELALFVSDEDPLVFYRALARIVSSMLAPSYGFDLVSCNTPLDPPSPFGIVEINEAFGPEVEALFREAGFRNVRTIVDFSGKSRHVFFQR